MTAPTMLETAAAVRRGEVTPVELVDAALDAITALDPAVNAFTVIRADAARREAEALRPSGDDRPLFGVPVVVKDLFDVSGTRTTGCCAAYLERAPATSDSAAVAALRAAGAVVVAKTNQHELACGATSQISAFGPVRNPWDTERMAGGSSGGSAAAVAARVVTLGLGSDTGGSIRIPAALCGVTGLKPTHGAVSLRGAMAMIPSLDSGGPIAVTAADCAAAFAVLAGADGGYLYSRVGRQAPALDSLDGLRVGVILEFGGRLEPGVRAAVEAFVAVLANLGARVVEVHGPDPDESARVWRTRWAEVANVFRDLWDDPRPSPRMRELLELGRQTMAVDMAAAGEVFVGVTRDFRNALAEADVLVAPTTAFVAPPADATEIAVEGGTLDPINNGTVRLTSPVNQAGLPALSLPVGFDAAGLPVGAQLIGPEWSDLRLCSIGALYQAATDWHLRRPAPGIRPSASP